MNDTVTIAHIRRPRLAFRLVPLPSAAGLSARCKRRKVCKSLKSAQIKASPARNLPENSLWGLTGCAAHLNRVLYNGLCNGPKVNQALPMETQVQTAVSVSPGAAKRIAALTAAEGPAMMFRIAVNGGGCSGFQYDFTFDDTPTGDDILIEQDGARVLIDQVSLEFIGGSVIDFVEDLMGSHFEIKNPQAKSSCGCGTSFSV